MIAYINVDRKLSYRNINLPCSPTAATKMDEYNDFLKRTDEIRDVDKISKYRF